MGMHVYPARQDQFTGGIHHLDTFPGCQVRSYRGNALSFHKDICHKTFSGCD